MANVSKLKIVSYDDPKTRVKLGEMEVQINPESDTQKIEIKYSEKQAPGTSGKLPKFSKVEPQKIDFEFMFDRTGVVNGAVAGELGVDEDINKLKSLMLEYKGEKHRPRFVRLYWGTLSFDGCLETMDISYKLFNSQGLPLRATVKTVFVGSMEDQKRVAKQNDQSPDLTHLRVIKAGETLPQLCYEIYGDSKYYASVAEANALDDFRNLIDGMKIKFPPLS